MKALIECWRQYRARKAMRKVIADLTTALGHAKGMLADLRSQRAYTLEQVLQRSELEQSIKYAEARIERLKEFL